MTNLAFSNEAFNIILEAVPEEARLKSMSSLCDTRVAAQRCSMILEQDSGNVGISLMYPDAPLKE